jgi:predicted ATP-grasp superfamily ATP-dependent carboligase
MRPIDPTLPPAILLGGGADALAVARNLRRRGIRVLAPGGPTAVRSSRCCEWTPLPPSDIPDRPRRWLDWLQGPAGRGLHGAVLFPCGDRGLEFVVRYRAEVGRDFLVYEANDQVLAAMLDKAQTYRLARSAGVPAPEVWITSTRDELGRVLDVVGYPCGLKPRLSHKFVRFTDEKLLVVHNAAALEAAFRRVEPYGVPMLVTELIPGGDAGYCSYYSYLDERGEPLFHFTKRKLRQFPAGFGTGTFHVTDWNVEVAELGLRFFQAIGLRGLACVEFKRDPRDGQLKLIEVNHRLTEPTELLTWAGLDLPSLVYNRLTGRPLPPLDRYRTGLCLAKPWEDFRAAGQLVRRGELSWGAWWRTRAAPTCYLYFTWWDPMPFLAQCRRFWARQLRRLLPRSAPRQAPDATVIVPMRTTDV